jgi:hypothetical protein
LSTILCSDWKGVLHLANAGSCFLSDLVAEVGRGSRRGQAPELVGGTGPSSFTPGWGPNGALDGGRYAQLSGRRVRDWDRALAASLALSEID